MRKNEKKNGTDVLSRQVENDDTILIQSVR